MKLMFLLFFFSSQVFADWFYINSGSTPVNGSPATYCATYPGIAGSPDPSTPYSFDSLSVDSYQCKFWSGPDGPCDSLPEHTWNQETFICDPPPPECDFPLAQASDSPSTTVTQTHTIPRGGVSVDNEHSVIYLCIEYCRVIKDITVTLSSIGATEYTITDIVSQTAVNQSCDDMPPNTNETETVIINPPGYGTGGQSGGSTGSGSGGGVGSGSGGTGDGGTGPGGADSTGTGAPQTGGSGSVGTGEGSTSGGGARGDRDGDGIINSRDGDIDGDGIDNGLDDDIDGDGIGNEDDTDPNGEEEGFGEAVVSSSCIVQPKCDSEDPVQCAILHQSWLNQCGFVEFLPPEASGTVGIESDIQVLEDELSVMLDEISIEVSNLINFSASGGGSIAPNYIDIRGVQVDFSFSRWVAELSMVGALILAMAWFFAVRIILSRG